MKMIPACKDYLWGGRKLINEYNKQSDLEIMAESWEISAHPDGVCKIESQQKDLKEFLQENREYLGSKVSELPILVKYIDALQSLSIQVHPDDEYARRVEGGSGKTEMWYIVDATEDAFIYYGVKEEMTKEEFRASIEDNTILSKLNKVNVKKGDYFLIEAGTIHAIGAGCLILETQQSANLTYRVYDYDRRDASGKKRELHIEKAIDVSTLTPLKGAGKNVSSVKTEMVNTPYFVTTYLPIDSKAKIETSSESFTAVSFISGEGRILYGDDEYTYKKGDSFMLPAQSGEAIITGCGECIYTVV